MVTRFPLIPAVVTLVAALCSSLAFASTEEARRLLNEGRAAQALNVLEKHLEGSPQDAEARFLRGLALSRTGRRDQAIEVFANLTRDYPQLPEPYNNLAVIYAQQGDYEKARDALEAALATHPSYATAHENLGDIYAALASASYNRALMLDENNPSARQKLKLMERLGASLPATRPNLTATERSDSTPVQPSDDAPASAGATTPTETATPAPASSAPAAAPAPTSTAERATRERISAAVYDWAQAWQNQQVDAYLDAYAPDFDPAGGLSRSAWEAQRRERVRSPERIVVRVRDPDIQIVDSDRARVTFQQEYESDSYSDVTTKVLDLRRIGDRWLILRETTR
ncbi:tetratricopeptide repeat protein [Algiphilus sp.]|uniref:tetratricopeptide repeat protein n=1 Tax=Algiphilus sp. TaxID=1872431 RepID=UPI002A5D1729|nr:tetratricopeptide repeat protein [Pseudomonadota bacterium]